MNELRGIKMRFFVFVGVPWLLLGHLSGFGESRWRRGVSQEGVELRSIFACVCVVVDRDVELVVFEGEAIASDGSGIPLIRFAIRSRHARKLVKKWWAREMMGILGMLCR